MADPSINNINEVDEFLTSRRQKWGIKEELEDECQICHEPILPEERRGNKCGDQPIKLPCGHDMFHKRCMIKWVDSAKEKACPICRADLDVK